MTEITGVVGQPLMLFLLANFVLLVFAPWIVDTIEGAELEPAARNFRIKLMRGVNLVMIVIIGLALVTGKS